MAEFDPNDTSGFEGNGDDEKSKKLDEKLRELQEMLYAEHKKVLIILQGMDTAGKDGVIHRVFQGVNPQGSESRTLECRRPRGSTTTSFGEYTKQVWEGRDGNCYRSLTHTGDLEVSKR